MKKLTALFMAIFICFSSMIVANGSDRIVSTADFSYRTFTTLTQRAVISFDICANTLSDGIVGIASSSVTPNAYGDYSICFRIRAGGFFDSNNGSDFSAANNVYYEKNKTYRVEIDADITNQVYNAFVYIDGVKHTVADNYSFRASANDLGKITARGGGGVSAGLYYIENITFTQGEGQFETFTLPNFFGENMVLQRNKPHRIYGRATGEVTAILSNGSLTSSATVKSENGTFIAELEPLPASLEPYTLTVSTSDKTQVIENVFVGDVFLLAGQSNMAQNYEHQLAEQLGGGVTTSNMPTLVTDERIKHFKLARTKSDTETFNVPFETNGWEQLDNSNSKKLSYIGMYFAKERLEEEPDVPMGLMSVAWRGTTINRWMRKSDDNKTTNYTPTNGDIYNNHIAPLTNYNINAILWYQGESDASNPVMYEEAFKTLITDWRRLWNDEDLPFLFVQLARYSGQNYAPQRNAQLKSLQLPNTGMAVILDTDKGTYKNIHPLGKEVVAKRLHLLAKKYVYGEEVQAEGPIFESAEVKDGSIVVKFRADTIGDGLCINNTYSATDASLCEFEIADEKGYFVAANATINPDNTVSVYSNEVKNPKFVRYAYSAIPENPNLFNKNGLPASPFSTEERIFSTNSFSTNGVMIEDSNVQVAQFNVAPMKDSINGVIGFTDWENTVSAWNSCGITVRFKENGYFEYIDGGSFVTSSLQFKAGESYSVKVIADFTNKTYSFVVDDKVLCENASFRTGSLAMGNMGRFLVRGGDGEAAEEFFIDNMNIFTPESNTVIETESGIFVLTPSVNVFVANYDEDMMTNVKRAVNADAVKFLTVNKNYRLFFWDENLIPIK